MKHQLLSTLKTYARTVALTMAAASTVAAPSLAQAAGRADEQTTPSNSGKARYQKQEKEIQGAQQTNLTKPAAPPPQQKETGPTITVDQFIFQKQGEIQKLVDAQIIKMRRLIQVTQDDDPQKPDFHFRLAELYAEKQRYYFSAAHGLDQKIFDAPPAQKATLQNQQKGYEQTQQKWLLEAVKSYIAATKFKKYERMDEVLFKLAYLLTSVKKEDQAREFFLRLIKDYPNSKYIPDAYLSFAEFYFDKAEMDAALKFYEKVEQFPKASVYPYAVYKKGWCYVNLGDYKTALETFVGVVRMVQEHKANVNPHQAKALEKEAKKDIVKAYSHVGGPDKAWEFFQRTGGDFAPEDDGGPRRAVLGAGQVPRLDARVPQGDLHEHGLAAHLRVAEQDRPQHAVGRHEEGPGPGDRAPRRRLRQGRRDEGRQEGPDGGVPQRLPRHVEGARAHLAQGSPAHEEQRHVRARQVRLQGLPRPLPVGQGRLRHGVLLRRAAVDARELEGRGRAVHEGRRDQPQGEVRQGRGLRGRPRLEERAQRRRPRAA